jgi:flagellar biosynthesis protein FlhG
MDAYALLKAMALDNGRRTFWVVTNMVADENEGQRLFTQFAAVAQRFLPVELNWAGAVPVDAAARVAALARAPLVARSPNAPAAIAITSLGARLVAHLASAASLTTAGSATGSASQFGNR